MPVRVLLTLLALCTVTDIVAGTVYGTVRDVRGQLLADAVVWATPQGRDVPSARGSATMDQRDRMFVPNVLAVQRGTRVEFPNSDDVQHHVYSFSRAKTFQLPLYKGTPPEPVVFDRAGVVMLGCNIHDRMSAFIVVVDTPHFAKTTSSGAIALRNLPPGRYAIHLWYPDARREVAPLTIEIAGDERHGLEFAPSGIRVGLAHGRP